MLCMFLKKYVKQFRSFFKRFATERVPWLFLNRQGTPYAYFLLKFIKFMFPVRLHKFSFLQWVIIISKRLRIWGYLDIGEFLDWSLLQPTGI